MKQVYHPYHLWEDWKAGMWRRVSGDELERFLQSAIEFTGDHALYGRWMMRVIHEWPYACEHNLTDLSQNRRAWIGHAACQLAIQCPEFVTRMAWRYLSKQQQDLANDQADRAIQTWEKMTNRFGGLYEAELFD